MPYDTKEFEGKLVNIHKNLVKEDQDLLILIDGLERSGKTTLEMKLGKLLRGIEETLENMIFHDQDFLDACKQLDAYPEQAVHCVDEAQNIFNKKRNDLFIQYAENILKSMGCFHQVWILCSPRAWELNHVLIERCHVYIHVYARGYAKVWVEEDAQTLLNALIKARNNNQLTSFNQIKPILKKKGVKPNIFADIEFDAMDEEIREQYNSEKKRRIGDMARQNIEALEARLSKKKGNGEVEEVETQERTEHNSWLQKLDLFYKIKNQIDKGDTVTKACADNNRSTQWYYNILAKINSSNKTTNQHHHQEGIVEHVP